ncbi:hypothetical protein HYE54_12015 [Aggregatibacter actinomycetemcomitans]|uniref:hypothetical protein n=1 Tax=Aggregatibacter actinomycetemcomitans TaxID=714 RepID=UPI00197B46D3|nr:hypothetical protein [Aggregatibacter actinomycetemcomitans]MBN6069425.1 hypothetical protein [Aggregatibacter actinomycetemcomitans]MBN6087087.1 hypothetical protein [Aggregatibacter actinomycetemcomitans]
MINFHEYKAINAHIEHVIELVTKKLNADVVEVKISRRVMRDYLLTFSIRKNGKEFPFEAIVTESSFIGKHTKVVENMKELADEFIEYVGMMIDSLN